MGGFSAARVLSDPRNGGPLPSLRLGAQWLASAASPRGQRAACRRRGAIKASRSIFRRSSGSSGTPPARLLTRAPGFDPKLAFRFDAGTGGDRQRTNGGDRSPPASRPSGSVSGGVPTYGRSPVAGIAYRRPITGLHRTRLQHGRLPLIGA